MVETQDKIEDYDDWGNDAQGANWIKLPSGESVTVIFTANSCTKSTNKFGKPNWVFDVVQVGEEGGSLPGLFSITSVKFLAALKPHQPLTQKCFKIAREGQDRDTKYFVELISSKEVKEIIKKGKK